MIVNGKEYDINSLMKTMEFDANSFVKVGNLMLTKEELRILDCNFIDYRFCNNLKDLMILIQAVLEDDTIEAEELDELDYVLEKISERDYYEYKNK